MSFSYTGTGSLLNYISSPFLYLAGLTKAASKLSLRQEVKQKDAPPAVKPAVTTTVSSYPSNGQIHSQYHGYYVKADVKIPPPEEPIGVEDDFHPSSLARLPPPTKQIWAPPLKSLPAPTSSPVPPKEGTKATEPPKPKRQESTKPKSLAETKKASVETALEIVEEELVSSSYYTCFIWILTCSFECADIQFAEPQRDLNPQS